MMMIFYVFGVGVRGKPIEREDERCIYSFDLYALPQNHFRITKGKYVNFDPPL